MVLWTFVLYVALGSATTQTKALAEMAQRLWGCPKHIHWPLLNLVSATVMKACSLNITPTVPETAHCGRDRPNISRPLFVDVSPNVVESAYR